MREFPLWVAIVTSAAVGALVSAVVNALSAWLERSARRKELLLTKAIDLSVQRTDLVLKLSDKMGKRAEIHDTVTLAEVYFQWLRHLLDKGRLPEGAPNRFLNLLDTEAAAAKQDRES